MTYPDGAVVDYVRNALGQATEVGTAPADGTRQKLLGGATCHPFGPSAGWSYGNGRPLQRMLDQLDQDYRPLAIQDSRSDGLNIGFGFGPVGNLTALTAPGNTAPVITLGYDNLNRLTAFKDGPTGTVIDGYSYDATGNRLSAQVNGSSQTYSYPTDSHRLASVAGAARSYDAMGNTTAIDGTAREFAYDATGRLSQAKRSGTLAMEYRYNDRGEQVRRFLGTTNTYTLYDEAGHWLGDYDDNGKALQQAIWLDDLPVGMLAGTALNYVQPDHLGAPRTVIDPVRDVAIWKWDIKGEAFGNTPPDQDPDRDGTSFVFGMRFPGQRYDSATGLNQNYFRDYDAGTGRYGQSDPLGLDGGISTYAYVELSPMLHGDHLGLAVYLCSRPINVDWIPKSVRPYLKHMWVKTSTQEAGMGGECPVPGQGCADVPYTSTATKSHTGQSNQDGAVCTLQKNVDEECVNEKIRPGQPTGTWSMINQCQSFSNAVIGQCRYGPQEGPVLPNTFDERGALGSSYSPRP